jgi:cytosine/adenosine deaminase-related metal-dependent hydrolase
VAPARQGDDEQHGCHTHGSVERGKVADLVIIDGDPLVDIAATANVRLVMQAGRVIRSPGEAPATPDGERTILPAGSRRADAAAG